MARLKSRLQKLETVAQQRDLSCESDLMLAATLGRLHALFYPLRDKPERWAAVIRSQRAYLAGSLGITARSASGDWKLSHHTRGELVAAGLAEPVKGSSETTGLRLTASGRSRAASKVAAIIPTYHLAGSMLARLQQLPPDRPGGLVAESSLFEIDFAANPDSMAACADSILEAVVQGAATSSATVQGHLFYRSTGEPFTPLDEPATDDCPDCHTAYVEAFTGETNRLRSLESTDGEIVIPLPVTLNAGNPQ